MGQRIDRRTHKRFKVREESFAFIENDTKILCKIKNINPTIYINKLFMDVAFGPLHPFIILSRVNRHPGELFPIQIGVLKRCPKIF